jgi:hypothetical protein
MSENADAITKWGFSEFVQNGIKNANVYKDVPRLEGASDR